MSSGAAVEHVVIQWLLTAARSGEPTYDARSRTLIFRYGKPVRAFALATTLGMPGFFGLLTLIDPPKDRKGWFEVGTAVGLFVALGLPLVWEFWRYRLSVSETGLTMRSAWRGWRTIPWDHVTAVSYSRMNMWFVVRGRDGSTIRFHLFVSGVGRFLDACERAIPIDHLSGAKTGYEFLGRAFPGG